MTPVPEADPQVAADVRQPALSLSKGLILSQRVRREKRSEPFDRLRVYLVTSAATLDW